MSEMTIPADLSGLGEALGFVGRHLEAWGCPAGARAQIEVAAEEIYVNIARYAYESECEAGSVTIGCEAAGSPPRSAVIRFTDAGRPYNPLARPDPDISLPAEKRPIGGLGVFLVKEFMDEAVYERRDGRNILTIVKYMGPG